RMASTGPPWKPKKLSNALCTITTSPATTPSSTSARFRSTGVVAGDVVMVHSARSEEHTSELQSRFDLVCRLLLEKKKTKKPQSCSAIRHAVGSPAETVRLQYTQTLPYSFASFAVSLQDPHTTNSIRTL